MQAGHFTVLSAIQIGSNSRTDPTKKSAIPPASSPREYRIGESVAQTNPATARSPRIASRRDCLVAVNKGSALFMGTGERRGMTGNTYLIALGIPEVRPVIA